MKSSFAHSRGRPGAAARFRVLWCAPLLRRPRATQWAREETGAAPTMTWGIRTWCSIMLAMRVSALSSYHSEAQVRSEEAQRVRELSLRQPCCSDHRTQSFWNIFTPSLMLD